jgi:thiol-disulfide isomerase/thioredoxin
MICNIPFLRSCLLTLVALLALPAQAGLRSFDRDSMHAIESELAGEPFLLVLWSVHCAPCFAELKLLAEMQAAGELPQLVLVATDPLALREEVELSLEDYRLQATPGWQFADPLAERLRYSIDPDWYGELPRSYFYRADGSREAHSGLLTRERLQGWIAPNVQ